MAKAQRNKIQKDTHKEKRKRVLEITFYFRCWKFRFLIDQQIFKIVNQNLDSRKKRLLNNMLKKMSIRIQVKIDLNEFKCKCSKYKASVTPLFYFKEEN